MVNAELCDMEAEPSTRVGVSGHRDLDPRQERDTSAVTEIALLKIANLLPGGDPRLVTGLAEGADQLVAEVALAIGWKIEALLPMSVTEYERDFPRTAARERLNELLSRCVRVTEMAYNGELDPDVVSARNQMYRNQGCRLIAESNFVILLWDGSETSPGACGTSWVAHLCRQKYQVRHFPVAVSDNNDGVVHVPVRRTG
jgi:hypothetical protein